MDVLLQAWGKVGVEGDGRAAFVFAKFRKDLVGERDGQAERDEGGGNGLLVGGIGKGEEERDGDGFGFRFVDVAAKLIEGGSGWSEEYRAIGADALGDAEA